MGAMTRVKSGRSGPLRQWYWDVCMSFAFVAGVVATITRSWIVVVIGGLIWVGLLVMGRRTGLFIEGSTLRLDAGGFTRWSVELADITDVTASVGWLKAWRLEVLRGSVTLPLPADQMSRGWSPDPAVAARETATALRKELRAAGATNLAEAAGK